MNIDIFNDNAFGLVELSAAIVDMPYVPNFLDTIGLITPQSSRTESVVIERRDTVLHLVPTTPRGAAPVKNTRDPRTERIFKGVRLAKDDTINASEIAGIRAFGKETEFTQAQDEVMTRMTKIRRDMDLTHEHMRLGLIQGIVLDADGTVLFDWFDLWGIAQPAEIVFDFASAALNSGGLRKYLAANVVRPMMRSSKGAWAPNTQIIALCGDEFYDALISSAEVRETYLGWTAAADLRGAIGQPFREFSFGEITWINYRGTDDNSQVAIPSTKVKFFPTNAPDAFMRIDTPGEFFDNINTPGQQYYAMTIPDRDRNAWVKVEMYSYPLYAATRPQMLLRGKLK
jgi:hypothetical protein